jgi:hypothetical protein
VLLEEARMGTQVARDSVRVQMYAVSEPCRRGASSKSRSGRISVDQRNAYQCEGYSKRRETHH